MQDCYYNYSNCHYLVPGVGIRQLLRNLKIQLKDYTMNDVCIIVIGESDFKKTENYINLVHYIKETLEGEQHTNIVLCTPTYICGAPVYNWRVEMFNTLLNLDIQNHEYAFYLDSNFDLSLDMFSTRTGKIRDSGIRNIFENTKNIIRNIMPKERELLKGSEVFHSAIKTNLIR